MREFLFAPLIETYHEGAVCLPYAQSYSWVFSLLQKPINVKVETGTVSGSEFQIEGLQVVKLRDPHRAGRLHEIVRSWWAAGRRCWRPVVDNTGMSVVYAIAGCDTLFQTNLVPIWLFVIEVKWLCFVLPCEVRTRCRQQWLVAVQRLAVLCWTAVASEPSGCWCWRCSLRWLLPSSPMVSR